ncbi:hypothetical protein SAMN05660473_04076 [Arthrobacter sp. 49Tsu3.1M3]|nr:hypothetical protein SAMN05660473_04076 [Arthrobacter sp. 49Tsu3.1M3]
MTTIIPAGVHEQVTVAGFRLAGAAADAQAHQPERGGDHRRRAQVFRRGERLGNAGNGYHPPAGPKNAEGIPEGHAADQVQDRIEPVQYRGEVLPVVVDDGVRPQPAHQRLAAGRCRGGDLGAEILGDLDGECSHPAGAAGDKEPGAAAHGKFIAEGLERREPGQRQSCGPGESQRRRDGGHQFLLHAHQLGEGSEPGLVHPGVDAVADGKAVGPGSDCFHRPGEFAAGNDRQADMADRPERALAEFKVHRVQPRRGDLDPDVTRAGPGNRNIPEFHGVRAAVAGEDVGAHAQSRADPVSPAGASPGPASASAAGSAAASAAGAS